jgi:DNA-binding NarL/FixJ family response regulator
MKTPIGLVDDHQLFLKSLGLMLESFGEYEVVLEAHSGNDLQQKIANLKIPPEIIFLDVNMPGMSGIETAEWLQEYYPAIYVVALSMNDDERTIVGMLKAGCCTYLLKDTHPTELEKALHQIKTKGFYNSESNNMNLKRLMKQMEDNADNQISQRDKDLLQLICSDLTYKEIAAKMDVSERTIDGYREALFQKFKVHSRVGLCLEALRQGFVKL